jgi:hypothetical protein
VFSSREKALPLRAPLPLADRVATLPPVHLTAHVLPNEIYQGALVAMRRHLDCNIGRGCEQQTSKSDMRSPSLADELLVQQHTVSNGQYSSPVNEGQSIGCLLSYLVDERRSVKLCYQGSPKRAVLFRPTVLAL